MSRLVVSAALLVVLAGVGVGWQSLTPSGPVPARDRARPFTVRTLDGRTLRLSELRGRPVIVDFWATWCAPCRASMPLLNRMQDRFASRGLIVLGLSVDDVPSQDVRGFVQRLRVRFPIGMASESVIDDYGPIRSIPTTIFIDRHGRIVRRVVGYVDHETLEGFVREIL